MCFRFLFSCNNLSHAIGFMSWWMDYIKKQISSPTMQHFTGAKTLLLGRRKAQGPRILKRKQNHSGIRKPTDLFIVIFFWTESFRMVWQFWIHHESLQEKTKYFFENKQQWTTKPIHLFADWIHCRPCTSLNFDTIDIKKRK